MQVHISWGHLVGLLVLTAWNYDPSLFKYFKGMLMEFFHNLEPTIKITKSTIKIYFNCTGYNKWIKKNDILECNKKT